MTRRSLLAGGAALTGCAVRRKPLNVLLVVADDQSYPHASAYVEGVVRTPAFDRIAREGTLFTNSFSACPSCTPSRTALLSGRHIWQTGEGGILYGTLGPELPLMPQALEAAGYVCGFTGKGWGPGDWKAGGLTRHPIGEEYNSLRHASVPPAMDERDYAANFGAFLNDVPAGQPFLFWLGATEPHRVYDEHAALREGIRVPGYLPDTPDVRKDFSAYFAEIEWYDAQLAKAVALLEAKGLLESTIVIVTSDNGMPFPRAKVNLYDGGLRMPLAIRMPGARRGQRCDALVSHTDVAPTILDACGLPPMAGAAGKSILPLLDDGAKTVHPHVLAGLERHTYCRPDGLGYPCRSLRTKDYLYIRNFAPDRWPTGGPEFVSSNKTFHGDIDGAPTKDVLVSGRFEKEYALCAGKRPAEELYHVATDPDCLRNLAAERPEIASNLRTLIESELRATGDPRLDGKDPWQAYPYRQTTGFGASFNTALPETARNAFREGKAHKPE